MLSGAGSAVISAESKTVPARGKALINTQLSIAVPEGTYGRIAPRSGLGTSIPLRSLPLSLPSRVGHADATERNGEQRQSS